MLGFRPTRSVIAISLCGHGPSRIGTVMRHDLELGVTGRAVMADATERFVSVAQREPAVGMILVFVDDRFGADLCGPADPRIRSEVLAVVERFDEELVRRGIVLADVFVAAEVAFDAPWSSLAPGGAGGRQPDPRSSSVAAAQVLGGRAILASREELVGVLTPAAAADRARVGAAIDDLRARTEPIDAEDLPAHRDLLEALLDRVRACARGTVPDRDAAAVAASALAHAPVRDAALAFAVGDLAAAAERLWVSLTRTLPDPDRAGAATLLAYSAYVRGDGPLAGVALDAALAADPGHVLARLLDTALRSGLRPERVRELADVGYECAGRIGVRLPRSGD
ncbi:protein of unknown function [Rhodococcus triatomae]|uniref:DUF4192 domain-containing protein n=2 Tax=Rhodococcus triatomae TaxID=300028 RepID=A0A1G8MS84_9NOCA|nr:protein of unknown function [Rhodococcus triatomae]